MAYCSSYYLYQRYEMRGGQEAIPSYPNVYSIDGEGSMPLRTRAMYDEDCGYMPDVQTIYRWNKAPSTQWECVGFDKHYIEYYQYSNDGGITWQNVEPVSSRTSSSVIEYNSQDCNYVPPTPQPEYRWTVITPTTDPSTYWCDNCPYGAMYRWNKAPVSDYECVGTDKHYKEYYQVSYDGGETWSNVVPTTSRTSSDVIEYNSQSCGGSTPTGYKFLGYYEHEAPYEVPCNSSSTLEIAEVWNNQREKTELLNAVIGNCVTEIAMSVFWTTSSLTSVTIPNSVTIIGGSAFQGCYGLTSVELPSSITNIGGSAFYHCSRLNSITIYATTPPTLDGGYAFDDTNNCPIYVPCSSLAAYKTASGWRTYAGRIYGIPPCNNYEMQYLTFEAIDSGTFSFSGTSSSTINNSSIQYSTDNGSSWSSLSRGASSPTISAGQKIMFKGNLSPNTTYPNEGIGRFSSTGRFNIEGNSMSLLYGDNYIGQTSLSGKTKVFHSLFSGCTGVTNAENLVLPATTLSNNCYYQMFYGCWRLTKAPALPATTLTEYCYKYMFRGCTYLTSAPTLPATTLAAWCYESMFNNCSYLATAPSLPATTLAYGCYQNMFYNCTSLVNAPVLPATAATNYCYSHMFYHCTSLATAPALPATNISGAYYCYENMFQECTSLTTAPALPATNLTGAYGCYAYMFRGCTGLTSAPALPSTTLTNGCYQGMFRDCTNITSAPVLSAATLAEFCYSNMFLYCSRLNYIKCLATDISASNCTYNWVNGVANIGTFVKDCDNYSWTYGNDGIPNSNWTVNCEGNSYANQYLTFNALESGTFGFSGTSSSTIDNSSIQYSLDSGSTWNTLTRGNTISVSSGQKVMWKSTLTSNADVNLDIYGIGKFTSSGRFNIEGNIMSIIGGTNFTGMTEFNDTWVFHGLFQGTNVVSAQNLVLPIRTLTSSCYRRMFAQCTLLTTPPKLPAASMADWCYCYMFSGCTSLNTTPVLSSTTLANDCYAYMFYYCTSITTVPTLPATTLKDGCYQGMYWGCSGITSVSSNYLPVTTLAERCYESMFYACSSLTTLPTLPATIMAERCYSGMFGRCTSITSVPSNYLPSTSLAPYCYEDMFSYTSITRAPDLPATTLYNYSYYLMFFGCSSLNYIKCLATNISASFCTDNWVYGVSSSGTFYKNSSMSSWTRGANGAPTNWTLRSA